MKMIPYGHHSIDRSDIKAVLDVLKSDWLTQGPKVKEFEDSICAYTGARYAVAVSSGTAALHIACLASGIGKTDEIITSPITFVASANCALYCQAKPVFADIQPDTINIDPKSISSKITKKTRAIIPVHFAGHPCDMDKISMIAKKHGLMVIEDACHAFGARYRGFKIGSCRHSDMAIFSFHPVKTIATGEGGAVVTNNKGIYEKLLLLRSHGITRSGFAQRPHGDWYYEMQQLGYNYRMTDIQAALGVSQLKRADRFLKRRREIARMYDASFRNNMDLDVPVEREYVFSSYHLYPIRLSARLVPKRRAIFSRLREKGLGVQVHYIPVYLQPYYRARGYDRGMCALSEKAYERMISIPLYQGMTDGDARSVVKIVNEVLRSF